MADRVARIGAQQVADEDEVAERLAHLLALVAEHAGVRPVGDPRRDARSRPRSGRARDSWCGKSEVAAAAVDLEARRRGRSVAIAEHSMCHPGRPGPHGDSHAGSSGSERCQSTKSSGSRLPGHVGSLPRSLAIGSISSRGEVRQLAEARPRVDVEVDVAVGDVGEPVVDEPLDHRHHLRDVLGGARVVIGRQPVERRHLGQEGRHVAVAEGEVVLAGLACLAQHVVVDIGQVLDVDDVVAEVLEIPMQDVEADVGERVPEVAGVVRRDAADVEADGRALADGRERLEPAAAGIVEAEGHGREF